MKTPMIYRFLPCLAFLFVASAPLAQAQTSVPRDNPYDVIGKICQPFWTILLSDTRSPNKACTLTITMVEVTGRLPKQMAGATLKAAVQFPDKVKLQAPVMGEEITVCRDGDEVWATPGQKVEYLLKQFKTKPKPTPKKNTPLFLPFTAQQAIFLPALFSVKHADVAEVDTVNGEDCRVITAGLMPQLAQAAKAEGFEAKIWVAPGYLPRQVKITQPDFTCTVAISDITFVPSLPASTWQIPAGVTDVYHTNSDMMDAVLFVVMNSLKMKEGDQPWAASK
ncbi:hypothetical protein BH09VER1_BH09VER1_21880 [soil metagenome]